MKRFQRGVSLIELTLFIGIIIMLAGIVFAAMGPIREKARQTVCVSNLHQLGQGLAMYQADYEGLEPTPGKATEYWELGLPNAFSSPYFYSTYVKNQNVLICPSDIRMQTQSLLSSYAWLPHGSFGQPTNQLFSHMVEKRGAKVPILFCLAHNPEFTHREPRWYTKRVIVLRLNQQVENEIVPIRTQTIDY